MSSLELLEVSEEDTSSSVMDAVTYSAAIGEGAHLSYTYRLECDVNISKHLKR